MKTGGNAESRAATKKEPLVRRMATPNVAAKESLDTQWTGCRPRAVKTDGDTEGHVGQVPARSGWATARGLQDRWLYRGLY